jgi:hypothetical protein
MPISTAAIVATVIMPDIALWKRSDDVRKTEV